jgi:hypothetical protein
MKFSHDGSLLALSTIDDDHIITVFDVNTNTKKW